MLGRGTRIQPQPDAELEAIKQEYVRRASRPSSPVGPVVLQIRREQYARMLNALGLLPLAQRRILDVGCRTGEWLAGCCRDWGGRPENCVGIDITDWSLEAWRRGNPGSLITLTCASAHKMPFADAAFDVVHQSMMLSSVLHTELRKAIANEMWRVLKPGGFILSYDFWINPLNWKTAGIRQSSLRRLFPCARLAHRCTITLAPPLSRALAGLPPVCTRGLERLGILNTHNLLALQKPGTD